MTAMGKYVETIALSRELVRKVVLGDGREVALHVGEKDYYGLDQTKLCVQIDLQSFTADEWLMLRAAIDETIAEWHARFPAALADAKRAVRAPM